MKQIQPFKKYWLQLTSIVVCRLKCATIAHADLLKKIVDVNLANDENLVIFVTDRHTEWRNAITICIAWFFI